VNVHIPTVEEIHMIAYLTVHGWVPDTRGIWKKPGVLRKPSDDDEMRKRQRGRYDPPLEAWELSDAYYHQLEEDA
jgi:hypothetical protein